MENVLNKNKGLKILQNISKIINGEKTDENTIPEDITTEIFHTSNMLQYHQSKSKEVFPLIKVNYLTKDDHFYLKT